MRWRLKLEFLNQLFYSDVCIGQNALQRFGFQFDIGVEWNSHTLPIGVLINAMASAAARKCKAAPFEDFNDLPSFDDWQFRPGLQRDSDEGDTNIHWLLNYFAVCLAIFHMQADSIFNASHRFFVGITLSVAALERGAGHKIALLIMLHDHGEGQWNGGRSICDFNQ
jgi:hypothetical protein